MLPQPTRAFDHVWILLTLLFTACSQLLIKWQVGLAGTLPADNQDRVLYLVGLFLRPWVVIALLSTFLAGVTWMIALSKFELSYAFPFYALNFPIVILTGVLFFAEPLTPYKLAGLTLIMLGVGLLAIGGAD